MSCNNLCVKMETNTNTETGSRSMDDFSKWDLAVISHNNGDFMNAIKTYFSMTEIGSRIFYNTAIAYVKLGDYRNAVLCLTSAVEKDENLAIAYFQRGTIHLLCRSSSNAIPDLKRSRSLLRGNLHINYRPLGLLCHLSEFTILHNLAIAYLLDGNVQEFRMMLTEATHNADNFQRDQISDTLKLFEENRLSDIQPVQLNTDAVFIPPKEITTSLGHRKSSKRSIVVFASNEMDNTPSYKCAERVEQLRTNRSQKLCSEMKRGGSLKDRVVQKIKSTGDLNISSHVWRNMSTRKQRHSTGSIVADSDIPYTTLKDIKQSRINSLNHAGEIQDKALTRPNDRKNVEGTDRLSSREDKCRLKNDVFIDHFDADTENILVSTNLMNDESKAEGHSDAVHAGSRRQIKGKAHSCGDLKNDKKREFKKQVKSTGYLDRAKTKSLLPLERKKKSRTSFKRLGRPKSDSKEEMLNDTTIIMEGCNIEETFLDTIEPIDSTRQKEQRNVGKGEGKCVGKNLSKCRYTLGSVFGDRSTVVKFALTEACDVITATATPTINPFDLKYSTSKEKMTSKQSGNVMVGKQKVQKSSKSKRAPDPPLPNVCSSLLAAGNIFTAMVQHDYSHVTTESSGLTDNVVTNTALDDRNRMTHIDISTKKTDKKQLEIYTNENLTILEESSVSTSLSNTLDMAFTFPQGSETEITQDINNNDTTSGLDGTFNEEHRKEFHTKEFAKVNEVNNANKRQRKEKEEMKLHDGWKISGHESIERCDDGNSAASSKVRNILKPKIAQQPPPSYPPPPLRISAQKKRYAKKGKKEQVSLNGIIGKSLLSSGMVIGALIPTHDNSDATNAVTACLNREADDNSSSHNVDELSTLMDAACDIRKECLENDKHVYVNVSQSFKPYNTYVNIDDITGNNVGQSQQQPEPEVIEEVFPVSPNLLRAFVVSNEKIRQAFGDFVLKQRKDDMQENTPHLSYDDTKHDYVNVTEL